MGVARARAQHGNIWLPGSSGARHQWRHQHPPHPVLGGAAARCAHARSHELARVRLKSPWAVGRGVEPESTPSHRKRHSMHAAVRQCGSAAPTQPAQVQVRVELSMQPDPALSVTLLLDPEALPYLPPGTSCRLEGWRKASKQAWYYMKVRAPWLILDPALQSVLSAWRIARGWVLTSRHQPTNQNKIHRSWRARARAARSSARTTPWSSSSVPSTILLGGRARQRPRRTRACTGAVRHPAVPAR